MIGLDTNVLVRYLVRDDKKQAEKASNCIRNAAEKEIGCFINHIVLCELVWVLESAYDFRKEEITGVLEKILVTRQFIIQDKDVVRRAVYDYGQGKGDLADYLIGGVNHMLGCDMTFTFDRSLRNSPAFKVLE